MVDDVPRRSEDENVARGAALRIAAEIVDDRVIEVDLDEAQGTALPVPELAGQGDHPGIAAVDHVLDVGGGHGEVAGGAGIAGEVEVGIYSRPRRGRDYPLGRDAPLARGVPRRQEEDAVYVLAHVPYRAQEAGDPRPRRARIRPGRLHVGANVGVPHHDEGYVVHVGDVVVDDTAELGRELHRARLRGVHEGPPEEAQGGRPEEDYRHDDDEGESPYQARLDAPYPHFLAALPIDARYSEGVLPVRFLKSEAK